MPRASNSSRKRLRAGRSFRRLGLAQLFIYVCPQVPLIVSDAELRKLLFHGRPGIACLNAGVPILNSQGYAAVHIQARTRDHPGLFRGKEDNRRRHVFGGNEISQRCALPDGFFRFGSENKGVTGGLKMM